MSTVDMGQCDVDDNPLCEVVKGKWFVSKRDQMRWACI